MLKIEPSQDEIEQAYREGFIQGYQKALDKLLDGYPAVKKLTSIRLTDKRVANGLIENYEGLVNSRNRGYDMGDLRYIKLAAFENAMEGE